MGNISWAYVTADRCLCSVSCKLHSVIFTPSGAGADAEVRNGDSVNAPIVIPFTAAAAVNTVPMIFKEPLLLDRGLFVDIGASMIGVMVQWEQVG